jgi:hypothetical protein
MASPQGSLSLLMNAGADAFSNLWDVQFTLPSLLTPNYPAGYGSWSVRVSDFDPPEPVAGHIYICSNC